MAMSGRPILNSTSYARARRPTPNAKARSASRILGLGGSHYLEAGHFWCLPEPFKKGHSDPLGPLEPSNRLLILFYGAQA